MSNSSCLSSSLPLLSSSEIKSKEKGTTKIVMENNEGDKTEEDMETEVLQLESLCLKCYENGNLKLLVHQIPQFDQVIVSSFECPHCGYHDNRVETAGALADRGCEITLTMHNMKDFNRQIVKSDHATLKLVELDFEIPAVTQQGKSTTIEGVLTKSLDDLKETVKLYEDEYTKVEARKNCFVELLKIKEVEEEKRETEKQIQELENTKINIQLFIEKMNKFVEKFRNVLNGNEFPLTIVLNDASGTSYLQSLIPLKFDNQMKVKYYQRTKEQLSILGYLDDEEVVQEKKAEKEKEKEKEKKAEKEKEKEKKNKNAEELKFGADIPQNLRVSKWNLNVSVEENLQERKEKIESGELNPNEEAIAFNVACSHCGKSASNNVCEIDIPGFRKCLIMAFVCDNCGAKENEVKPAGAYGDKARRWTLRVENAEDLNRDVLKSDTASIEIPHINFEMSTGTQGGVFTTVEGLLVKMADHLSQCNPFSVGDAAQSDEKNAIVAVIQQLRSLAEDKGNMPFTIIMDDAADQSFIGKRSSNFNNDSPDTNLLQEVYERSDEQNEALGLKDMKVENY